MPINILELHPSSFLYCPPSRPPNKYYINTQATLHTFVPFKDTASAFISAYGMCADLQQKGWTLPLQYIFSAA